MTVYRDCTPVADAWYDVDGKETLIGELTKILSDVVGTPVTELPPLYEHIDTDALTRLLENHDGASEANATLGFEFEEWNVFVRADGRIRVCDGTKPTEITTVFHGEPA
jgi:hypothetical protein